MILCVDDDPLTGMMVSEVLQQGEMSCAVATSAAEAVVQLRANPPELILLDLELPDADGFELFARIRAEPGHQHTPVIILSSSSTAYDIRRGLGMGAEDYLIKPVIPAMLLAKIEAVYRRQAATTPARSATLADAPAEVREAASNPDNLVDKYVIVAPLGTGGMGSVVKAWDTTLETWAALKFIADQVDQVSIVRLQREAQTLVRLHHDHICRVYDLRKHEGRHYLAIQYIDGEDAEQQFEPVEAAIIVERVAQAVHYAHQQGVIHRDIKPANILLDSSGKPWITDFGISTSRLHAQSRLTPSDLVVGSPCYMAPELFSGTEPTAQTDVYGLGATLYDMVTGEAPFDIPGQGLREMIRDIETGNLRPPSELEDSCPEGLERIIMKAMAGTRRRYPTAQALAEDLEAFLVGEEPSAATERRGWFW